MPYGNIIIYTVKVKLKKLMSIYKDIMDNLFDGLYFVDKDRKITYWNSAAEQITGFSSSEVLGKCCADNILKHVNEDGVNLCKSLCPLAQTLIDGKQRKATVYLHHKDSHRLPVSVRISPIRDENGNIIGASELFNDETPVAAIIERNKELEKLSLLDTLTSIANRRYIKMTMFAQYQAMKRYGASTGVLFIDIDNFKNINDTYGHNAGDEILKIISQTLTKNSRPFDVFGRWGGEEFIGIIYNVDKTQLESVANKLRLLIENSYIINESTNISVTVSMGATLIKPDDTPEDAINRADKLMYESKKTGKNRVTVDLS